MSKLRLLFRQFLLLAAVSVGSCLIGFSAVASAAPPFPPETSSGSVGLQGTISTAAPTQGATITTPVNGATFSSIPVSVNGLCPKGLLVKVFDNNVFVGSVVCTNGSYSLPIDLFSGQNDIVTRVYDALDQPGPDSNIVRVTFNDAQFAHFGTHVSLTSNYAKRGANPGEELDWPIILSGGDGPYALSIDWGDSSPVVLMSEAFPGTLTIKHTYKTAGTYNVIVKATDANGGEAFLELVGVADGAIQSDNSGTSSSSKSASGGSVIQTKVLWWPAVAMMPLIAAAFWVGRRHELFTLRKTLEKSRSQAKV